MSMYDPEEQHTLESVEGYVGKRCSCGQWFDVDSDHEAHLAEVSAASDEPAAE